MVKVRSVSTLTLAMLFSPLLMISSTQCKANGHTTPPAHVQLAYFIGYHNYYGGGYYRPGLVCKQKCYADKKTGRLIRCEKRC